MPARNGLREAQPPRAPAAVLNCVGTGDAFGSGGRFHTCFHLAASGRTILLDCGASALIGLRRQGLDPALVDIVVLTHFHGDHYGGVPFLLRERQIESRGSQPLTVIGPLGTSDRLTAAAEAMFPGSTRDWKKTVEIVEVPSGRSIERDGTTFRLLPVVHTPGTNAHGLRVDSAGCAIAYSGDTEWTASLPALADGADVFICECYSLAPKRNHMDYTSLLANVHRLNCNSVLTTHMGADVLAALPDLEILPAADGLSLELPALPRFRQSG